MRMKFVAALVALLIGSSAAMCAELHIPTKGGTKYGKPTTTVQSAEKSNRLRHGASNCTFASFCLESGAQVANR